MRHMITSLIGLFAALWALPIFSNNREELLIAHIKHCLFLAEENKSQLTPEILALEGMSGTKFRHFLNNLCTLPNTSYLEIGCWQGSTLVAALYGNTPSLRHAIAVDNWAQFQGTTFLSNFYEKNPFLQHSLFLGNQTQSLGPKNAFYQNIERYLPTTPLRFYEQDCFTLPLHAIFPFPVNIYFYDGAHEFSDQEQAFTYFNDIFDDIFIAIVDDWNHLPARKGTLSAFNKLKYTVVYEKEIFTEENATADTWWNGTYIAVIKKN